MKQIKKMDQDERSVRLSAHTGEGERTSFQQPLGAQSGGTLLSSCPWEPTKPKETHTVSGHRAASLFTL